MICLIYYLFRSIYINKYFLNEISGTNYQIMYHSNSTEEELDRRKKFYKNLNGEAINGKLLEYYYFLIWFIFTTFQISFIIGSLSLSFKTNNIQSL